jgi:hypothetical protein
MTAENHVRVCNDKGSKPASTGKLWNVGAD